MLKVASITVGNDQGSIYYQNAQEKLHNNRSTILPCTPNVIITVLKSLNINLSGKNAVVIVRSNIVGKPVSSILLKENYAVITCYSKTINLQEICRLADILVVAIGKAEFINEKYISNGQIILDVGTNRLNDKMVGDAKIQNLDNFDIKITKVFSGIGSLITTLLFNNLIKE